MTLSDNPAASGAESIGQRLNGRDDHHCFGCGQLNPYGLKLSFYPLATGEEGVWTPWTPARVHEGFTGIVHGGIITTVLDEVMAWALYQRQIWAVTGRINVSFRRPVEVGVPLRAIGRVMADRGRLLDLAGELRRVDDGQLLASATATFARVPDDQAKEWEDRYVAANEA